MRNSLLTTLLLVALVLCSLFTGPGCASSGLPASTTNTAEPAARPRIILVCPFDVITRTEDTVHLSLAMAPLLRRDLFCVQQISVIPTEDTHTTAKLFFYKEEKLRKVAAAYGADIVTVGLINKRAEKVSVEFRAFDFINNARSVNTKGETDVADIFKLEKKIVFRLVDAMNIPLRKAERRALAHCSPDNPAAALEFGRGLQKEREENYTASIMALREAAKAADCFGLPYAAEARIMAKNDTPAMARDCYLTAVKRDEFFAEAWYDLNLHAAGYLKDDDLAIAYCRKALEIAPLFGKARQSLGARLHATGNIEEAIEETKRAAELMPANPMPLHNLGVCYRDAGRPDEARKWFQRALEIDPGFTYASAELQKLNAP